MNLSDTFGKEHWLPVVGYESKFLVSDHGKIFSFYLQDFLKPHVHKGGHLYFSTERSRTYNIRNILGIHVAVLEAFVGPKPSEEFVCRHLDDIPSNNFYKNLVWGTHSENLQDRKWNRGTTKYKLWPEDVRAIKIRSAAGERAKDLCIEFGVHIRTIYDIRQGLYHKDVA